MTKKDMIKKLSILISTFICLVMQLLLIYYHLLLERVKYEIIIL